MKSRYRIILIIQIVMSMLIIGMGCDSKESYIGTYQAAVSGTGTTGGKIFIQLNENGEGVWRRGDEEVAFTWFIKNKELRIYTKDGGTMVGRIKRKGFAIIFPDEEEVLFKKIM